MVQFSLQIIQKEIPEISVIRIRVAAGAFIDAYNQQNGRLCHI